MYVGALNSYSSAVQYKYFAATISASRLDDLLRRYGIQKTGDEDKDLDNLHQVMSDVAIKELAQAQGMPSEPQKAQKPDQATQSAASTEVPWASLMSQVGLFASGNLDTDYISFMNQVSLMKVSAGASSQDKANIEQLMAQASVVFVAQNQPAQVNQPTTSSTDNSSAPQQISGVDILARLNKMYMLGY